MKNIILKTNTSLHGDDIHVYQLRDSEIAWDQINKSLVVKGYKDDQLYSFPVGGEGGTTDHTQLTSIGNYTHPEIDDHIENRAIHFNQSEIIITENQISDLQNYVLSDDIVITFNQTTSDDKIPSEKLVKSYLDLKSNIDHTHSEYVLTEDLILYLNTKVDKSSINQAYGVAGLNEEGKIDIDQLPEGIAGGLVYKGTWNPNTNEQGLGNDGVGGVNGEYYKVSEASDEIIDDNTDWYPGDWIIHNGTTWDKIDNTESVVSVNGKIGIVVINKDDIGLSNADNTSDLNKPISTLQQSAIDLKEDKILIKYSGFNLDIGTVAGTVAEGNHSHIELHTHDNKIVLDGTEESFTTALKTKLDGLENYTHPTGEGNLHIPINTSTEAVRILSTTATAGVYSWIVPISSHDELSDIGTYNHDAIDIHIEDNITHVPTPGNSNPNKVLTSTALETSKEWKALDDLGMKSENVSINPLDLINSISTSVEGVLIDFDTKIAQNLLLGDYETNDIVDLNTTIYVLMENRDSEWMFKKVVENAADDTFELTYANKSLNPTYDTYLDAKPYYDILVYDIISNVL